MTQLLKAIRLEVLYQQDGGPHVIDSPQCRRLWAQWAAIVGLDSVMVCA